MPTRRDTLKTFAGGAVVGSLSGCVQFATQRSVEYHGTPAMARIDSGGTLSDLQPFSTAVGVEARSTVERFGVTKEIVAHSWGILYVSGNDVACTDCIAAGDVDSLSVASFTTPSITIAGQELNPITDLTVGEIGTELLATVRNGTAWPGSDARLLTTSAVQDATGKKVLRAFRDAVGDGNQVEGNVEYTDSWTAERTIPDWDGDTHEASLTWTTGAGDAGTHNAAIRFEEHDGDYLVVFGAAPEGAQFNSGQTLAETVKVALTGDYDGSGGFVHPPDADFDREVLRRHLVETNVRGTLGLVERARTLIDETRELLEMGNYEKETLIQTVSDIQRTIGDVQETLQGCDSDACETVLGHADDRSAHARDAKQALQNDAPGDALESLRQARAIIEEDIALLEDQDSDAAARALRLERTLLDDTDRASRSAAQWQTLLSTNQALDRVDRLVDEIEDELSAVLGGAGTGGSDGERLNRARETAKEAAAITKKAHERVASNNDTRDEEDERFVQIEQNLGRLERFCQDIAQKTGGSYTEPN